MSDIFDHAVLVDDLSEVRRIYVDFFGKLDGVDWDKPIKGSPKEWDLHETIAHSVALNGAGLASIKHTLRGEPYIFVGLDDRYKFNAYNRQGIDDHLNIPVKELCAQLLDILDQAAGIARNLQPGQGELTAQMPIYNRPVSIVEALSIIVFHSGLVHTAQVAEPADMPPLWKQHSLGFRHRVIGRTMLPFSLLYRRDIGGSLRATLVFRIDGPDGGEWYVSVSPDSQTWGEGVAEHPQLVVHLRETAVLCQMITGRMNLPLALLQGRLRLHGDLRLFLRMNTLFSIDAKPKAAATAETRRMTSTDRRTSWSD